MNEMHKAFDCVEDPWLQRERNPRAVVILWRSCSAGLSGPRAHYANMWRAYDLRKLRALYVQLHQTVHDRTYDTHIINNKSIEKQPC